MSASESLREFRDALAPIIDGEASKVEFEPQEAEALAAEIDALRAELHDREVRLVGYEEFKAARTAADADGDPIWEFYDRKLWASIQMWKSRAERFERALKTIEGWDCLNPPDPGLCADHPWLRSLVDEALDA